MILEIEDRKIDVRVIGQSIWVSDYPNPDTDWLDPSQDGFYESLNRELVASTGKEIVSEFKPQPHGWSAMLGSL